MIRVLIVIFLTIVTLPAFGGPSFPWTKTTGEKIRNVLSYIDSMCKEMKIGPYLDTSDPEYKQKRRYTDCELLKVRLFDRNTVLDTVEGRFAYSVNLPAPLDVPRVLRKNYRDAPSYFDALCNHESGEHIFSTVDDVQGVRIFRTPQGGGYSIGPLGDEALGLGGGPEPEGGFLTSPPTYRFVERPARKGDRRTSETSGWLYIVRDSTIKPSGRNLLGLRDESLVKPRARYGYLWRGTEAYNDREIGILGAEIVVFDFEEQKVLAVKRSFLWYDVLDAPKHHLYFKGQGCPKEKDYLDHSQFVKRVLRPEARQ